MPMPYACKIKFCGLRAAADVRVAAELGVAAVGFVLTVSPRQVTPEVCARLRELVPAGIRAHGVFAAESPEEIRELMKACGLDVAQVHAREDDDAFWAALAGVPVIRAFGVKGRQVLAALEAVRGEEFLLDASVPGAAGGTGRTFDWVLAREASACGKVILAGGLTPENVAAAIGVARPYMVDVSGGVEQEPGVKDHELMRAFVAAVTVAG